MPGSGAQKTQIFYWRLGVEIAEIAAPAALAREQAVVQRLDAAQIANARVDTMAEVWAHPQLQGRGRCREVGSALGPVPVQGKPASR